MHLILMKMMKVVINLYLNFVYTKTFSSYLKYILKNIINYFMPNHPTHNNNFY